MAIIENPVLAMPVRPEGRLSFRQFLRLVRENTLGTYPPEAFDDEIIAGRLLWRRRFIINEPSGIRHVLLDNAANYRKSELTRRLLEPGLGCGLLTSEGETWRRHRRIMAPAFDRLSGELCTNHYRGDERTAGTIGRLAEFKRGRRRGGDDAHDAAHHLAHNVLRQLR